MAGDDAKAPRFGIIPRSANGRGLSGSEWAVLHAISLHADKRGLAWPSLAKISEITGIERRHVWRTTKSLEQREVIRVRPGSAKASTRYEILDWPRDDGHDR